MKNMGQGKNPNEKKAMRSILCAFIGILWTYITLRLGAGFLAVLGVFFVLFAVMQTINYYKIPVDDSSASEEEEEQEAPAEETPEEGLEPEQEEGSYPYCPFCGAKTKEGHLFCRSCGKKLSE